MDIYCASCQEPWGIHHMLHDAVWDTPAGIAIIDDKIGAEEYEKRMTQMFTVKTREAFKIPPYQPKYTGETWNRKLTPFWEEQFNQDGWTFIEHSLMAIRTCPCCKGAEPSPGIEERIESREIIVTLLGGDLDGLACAMSDLGSREMVG